MIQILADIKKYKFFWYGFTRMFERLICMNERERVSPTVILRNESASDEESPLV